MFHLRDFLPIRPADAIVQEVIAEEAGMTVIAGPEGRSYARRAERAREAGEPYGPDNPSGPAGLSGLLPSGRAMVFRAVVDEIMGNKPDASAILVSHNPPPSRSGRTAWRYIRHFEVDDLHPYPSRIMEAAERNPTLLLVERLDRFSVVPALEIAQRGLHVIAQLDTPLRGRGVYRQLMEFGATSDHLHSLRWILTIQRLPTLCTDCRRAILPGASDLQALDKVLRFLEASGVGLEMPEDEPPILSESPGCLKCQFTGRQGDAAVLEICQVKSRQVETRLPIEASLWRQVQRGFFSLRDLLFFDQEVLHRTFNLLVSSEHALAETQGALERTRSELESVSRVLEHRNQALFSFQDIGYALIRSDDLYELASRVCRRANELCGADRSILYYLDRKSVV